MCECIRVTQLIDGVNVTVDVNAVGFQDGKPSYSWTIGSQVYWMAWSNLTGEWTVFFDFPYFPNNVYANFPLYEGDCPPNGIWQTKPDRRLATEPCGIPDKCDCGIQVAIRTTFGDFIFDVLAVGTINGKDAYQWMADIGYGMDYFTIRWNGVNYWILDSSNWGLDIASVSYGGQCPLGEYKIRDHRLFEVIVIGIECSTCGIEDRTQRTYKSVKLPENFVEDNRGLKGCCCEYLVLGDPSNDTWKNDITSAWIKMADTNDIVNFLLMNENGDLTNYSPQLNQMPNDSLAFYTTISWIDVLNSDGEGCYELLIEFSIAGVTGTVSWGHYKLQPYSIQNAMGTARIKAVFNGNQESEGIDFTNADVVSTLRFSGYIGNRQPNTELDNIIYSNREMKRVIRENLNSYEIITDPVDECFTKPLLEVFLLSENELYISDYNAHNHSYRYNDIPVILEEGAEVEYYDFSRKAKVTAVVSDKFKNKRTYY